MHLKTKTCSQIQGLPGIFAGAFAVIIGGIALFTSFPSLGRQSEYGFMLSPAAGGFLFILLGLSGALGAFLDMENRKAVRGLIIFGGLLALSGLAAFAVFGEWKASIILIIIAATTAIATLTKKGAILLLFVGLGGFPIGQLAITTLPYGWKTWAIPGVLFLFSGLFILAKRYLNRLPLLNSDSKKRKRQGYFIYGAFCLILILLAMAFLIHIPTEPAGKAVAFAGEDAWRSDPWSQNGTTGQVPGLNECDCINRTPEKAKSKDQSYQGGELKAFILAPEDVRTFPRNESIGFVASAFGNGPLGYLWTSSLDGPISRNESFHINNLSLGWHNITLTITDGNGSLASSSITLGIAEPQICGKVRPRPKYYPIDTPCQDIWPNATEGCQELEVCHPDLDYIVTDAVDCCDGTPLPGSACAYACNNSGGDKKKCRGLYIIRAFGPEAKYMQGYALFKACCSGYPECTRTCGINLSGTCSFREGFNVNVSDLSCRPEEWGVGAWKSDRNMSMNSAVLGLFPTHATVNTLRTGVCIDYAAAVTTALRKAGYNKTEAFSTGSTGYELPMLGNHPGHAYNLVLLPGDSKYHIVDTTGNGEGINLGGVPHYFRFTGCFAGMPVQVRVFDWWVGYCSKTGKYSYNDAGNSRTPERFDIFGCQ
jgi:hypothetical protein